MFKLGKVYYEAHKYSKFSDNKVDRTAAVSDLITMAMEVVEQFPQSLAALKLAIELMRHYYHLEGKEAPGMRELCAKIKDMNGKDTTDWNDPKADMAMLPDLKGDDARIRKALIILDLKKTEVAFSQGDSFRQTNSLTRAELEALTDLKPEQQQQQAKMVSFRQLHKQPVTWQLVPAACCH